MNPSQRPLINLKPSTWPFVLVAGAYLVLYVLLDLLAMQFTSPQGISIWYPPVGLDMALLMGFGLRYLPVVILGNVVHNLVVPGNYNWADYVIPIVMGNGVYGLAVWVLNRLRIDRFLGNFSDVRWFMFVAAFAGSFVAAALQTLSFIAANRLPYETQMMDIATFWAGDSTGITVVAPLLLAVLGWLERTSARPKEISLLKKEFAARWIDKNEIWLSLGQLVILGLAVWFAFGTRLLGFNYQYAIFIPIIVYAVQRGYCGAIVAVLTINIVAVILAHGKLEKTEQLATLQFCLAVASYIAVLLGAVLRDRDRAETRIRELALFDPLTGLLNRAGFVEQLEQKLYSTPAGKMALITFDINHFRSIAASRGNAFADELVRRMGERLTLFTGPQMSSARLGGDSFGVALERVPNPTTAQAKAENLHYHLSQPIYVSGEEVRPSLSFGVALNIAQAESTDSLFRRADTARVWIKTVGEGRVVLFDPSFADQPDRMSLERDLHSAIERREFLPYYQPVMDLKENQVMGLEALARWNNPNRGLVSPTEFIPLAEETGLIVPLSYSLLWQALAHLHYLQGKGHRHLTLHINLSARLLIEPDLVPQISEVLREYEIAPSRIILEITESLLVEDDKKLTQQLEALRELGVRLAMDDFGTGYSSMLALKRLPVLVLKIDRTFMEGVPENPFDNEMVRTILNFAANMGLTVVVEGVETLEQHRFLRQNGFPRAQGYFYGKPMTIEETEQFLGEQLNLTIQS